MVQSPLRRADEPAAAGFVKVAEGFSPKAGEYEETSFLEPFVALRGSFRPRLARWAAAALLALALLACGQRQDTPAMNEQLIAAAERGDTAAVQRLLAAGAELNARDARGRTAALAATHGNQAATVQALIAAGADINIRDNRSDNVLLYAGAEGLLEIVRLAIAAGADPKLTNRFGGTALIPAAERGHVAVVRELLVNSKVDVNHVNNLGWTALLEAIILSDGGPAHQQIVELLIAHGADAGLPDKDGVTPLAHARRRGYRAIADLLVAAGAL